MKFTCTCFPNYVLFYSGCPDILSGTVSQGVIMETNSLGITTCPSHTSGPQTFLHNLNCSHWCVNTSQSNLYINIDLSIAHLITAVHVTSSQSELLHQTFTLQYSVHNKTWQNIIAYDQKLNKVKYISYVFTENIDICITSSHYTFIKLAKLKCLFLYLDMT